MSTTFEHWKLDKLKNHHLNAEVFGEVGADADGKEFIESIKAHGVVQPAIIAPDGTIISGHRRRQGAARAGLKEIDVIVRRDLTDPVAIDRAWFEANRQREMTTEQKARWFKKREAIEAASAEKREKSGKSDPAANLPQGSRRPTSADVAAAEVGLGRKTAAAAAKVVDAIDKAEAKGDKDTAKKLRDALNNGSVSAAKREADKSSGKPAKKDSGFQADRHFKVIGTIMRALDDVKAKHGAIQEYKTAMQAARELHNAIDALDLRLQK